MLLNILGCSPKKYGESCSIQCPQNCQEGHCDIVTGACLGCVPGYTGQMCTEGTTIKNVSRKLSQSSKEYQLIKTQIKELKKISTTKKIMFKMIQIEFFFNITECQNNTYGLECTEICGKCMHGEQCHHVNGSCFGGCAKGRKGVKCNQGLLN